MRKKSRYISWAIPVLFLMCWAHPAPAEVFDQCPCLALDTNGKPDPTQLLPTGPYAPTGITVLSPGAAYNNATQNIECSYTTAAAPAVTHSAACKALSAGDGHVQMADGNDMFIFGFDNMTGIATNQVLNMATDPVAPGGMRGAEASAPTINIQAGQEFYLSLTNVSMVERPDLVDPHTVHYHGFPNAASVFDGEPVASLAVNIEQTLTYYYNNREPGTYMYHCHVEASEHMQMGMLGNLYVRPQQDGTPYTYLGKTYTTFAYNDGDGSTGYDVGYPMEVTAFDPVFHHADNTYNAINFADMDDTYTLFNGRGYPDTVNPCPRAASYPFPVPAPATFPVCDGTTNAPILNSLGVASQNVSSLVTAKQGQKILLRMPSLGTTDFYTVTLLGLPMQVIGQGARQLKAPAAAGGLKYYYNTNSVTIGGGEGYDLLIDTTNATAGTYFLYTTNLNRLSNNADDFGGLMTEIVVQ